MPDIPNRLAEALADRYRLERELGQGGMATVYLAEDLKHRRKVAVKVLRPELAATLGPGAVPPRDRARRPAPAPPHPPAPRLGRGPGLPLLRHAVRGRGEPARTTHPSRRAADPGGRAAPGRGGRRALLRPRAGRGPPRHQAGQRAALRTARAGDRLRRRQGGERGHRPAGPHHRRHRARHAGLHGARAGGRPTRTSITGWTSTPSACWATSCSTGTPPFTGQWPQEVLAAHVTQPARADHLPPAADLGGARRHRHEVPRQAPGRPLAERRGAGLPARAAAHAERRDDAAADPDGECRAAAVDAPLGAPRGSRAHAGRGGAAAVQESCPADPGGRQASPR